MVASIEDFYYQVFLGHSITHVRFMSSTVKTRSGYTGGATIKVMRFRAVDAFAAGIVVFYNKEKSTGKIVYATDVVNNKTFPQELDHEIQLSADCNTIPRSFLAHNAHAHGQW